MFRIVQGVGGACLMANSAAILTDAFPVNQRGMALGINNIVGVSGMFIGLVLGGLLAPINWRLVFLISVPVGLFGTVWAYLKLEERSAAQAATDRLVGQRHLRGRADLLMVAVTYGIRPYGTHSHRLESPRVLALIGGGIAFAGRVRRDRAPGPRPDVPPAAVPDPGVHVRDAVDVPGGGGARRPDVHADHLAAGDLAAPARLQLLRDTPLWAGIYMLPLTAGLLFAGPTSGYLSDRFGARPFATGGMIGAALSFVLLLLLPIDFSYPVFAAVLAFNGISMGLFASPNRAGVMNSLPRGDRGAGGGMNQTFQNSAQVVSIGIFFTPDGRRAGVEPLPHALTTGLDGARRPPRPRPTRRPPAPDLDPVRGVPGLQPARALARRRTRSRRSARTRQAVARRPVVLPAPDLRRRSSPACARRSRSRSAPASWRPALR